MKININYHEMNCHLRESNPDALINQSYRGGEGRGIGKGRGLRRGVRGEEYRAESGWIQLSERIFSFYEINLIINIETPYFIIIILLYLVRINIHSMFN